MAHLISKRLRIEPLRAAHAPMVHPHLQAAAIYTYLPEDPPTLAELQRRYDFWEGGRSPDGTEQWLNWVAFLRDTTTPVGTFQATIPQHGEGAIAYVVFPAFWRQGVARELATAVITHIFQAHDLSRLCAEIDTRNTGSIRLVESLGLTRIATTRGADFFKGASSDEYTYSVSREDWCALQPPVR